VAQLEIAVQRFSRCKKFPAAILARVQEDFLRCGFRAFFDFDFRCGFDGSEIQAGGSLAGKDSSEASSTGSALESPGPRSGFGDGDFCFSAGLAICTQFCACRFPRVIR
jgi:hypothetical protein